MQTKLNREFLPALASAMLGIVLFAVSVGGTYIFDDRIIIQADPRIQHPALWVKFWTQNYQNGVDKLYRPLVSMSYAIQWWLHGDRPWAFHLVNILLHGAVSACIAELTRRLMGWRAAIIAGLLFAAHPIHVEAVAGVVGRAELMCALGIFGAMILMLRPMTLARALAIAGCFVLALLSKEQGMLLPLMLLILSIYTRSQSQLQDKGAEHRTGIRILTLSLCWLLAGYILWRESILKFEWNRSYLDWTVNPMVANSLNVFGASVGRDRWLMPLTLLGRYTALLVVPFNLSIDYGGAVIGSHVNLKDPYLFLGIFALVSWVGLFILAVRRRLRSIVFALLCLGLTYGMIGNIVMLIGTIFGERLMYIPSAFFLMIVAAGLSRVPQVAMIAMLSVALVLSCARSFTYAVRWNDPLKFYETALREQPQSIRLHMLLAGEYERNRRFDDADPVLSEARQLLPQYSEIWVDSGILELNKRDFDKAREYFLQAIQIDPLEASSGWIGETERRRAAASQPAR